DSGKVQSQPLPVKPKPPKVTTLSPDFGPRGQTVRVTLSGQNLQSVTALTADAPEVTARFIPDGATPTRLTADLTLPPTLPAGVIKLAAQSPGGAASAAFTVDLFPDVPARRPNDASGAGEPLPLDRTVIGSLRRVGDVDFYRFEAKAGQPVGVQAF